MTVLILGYNMGVTSSSGVLVSSVVF